MMPEDILNGVGSHITVLKFVLFAQLTTRAVRSTYVHSYSIRYVPQNVPEARKRRVVESAVGNR